VRLGQIDRVFDALISDGSQVWAVRRDRGAEDGAALWRVVDAAGGLVGEETGLPARCLSVACGPEGTFYAAVAGPETWPGPSVSLWRYAPEAAWQEVIRLRDPAFRKPLGAAVEFVGGRVVIGLAVEAARDASGITPPDEPLRVFDPGSGALHLGPPGIQNMVGNGEVLYAVQAVSTGDDGFSFRTAKSGDGVVWTEIAPFTQRTLNDLVAPLDFGIPQLFVEGRGVSLDPISGALIFSHETAGGVVYRLPSPVPEPEAPGAGWVNTGPGLVVFARGAENCVAFYDTPSTEDAQGRRWMLRSEDFLNTFEVMEVNEVPPVGSATTHEAFYFLRIEAGASALYRLALPTSRVRVVTSAHLTLRVARREFLPAGGTESEERTVLELGTEADAGAFYQVRTSTDLNVWAPLGLPTPAGATRAYLIETDVPRRFFR
jgi:hypothetical protein